MSLRFSPLLPGATFAGFLEVVVDEPIVIEPMVDVVLLAAAAGALVVDVEVPTLLVLVSCLGLPQSLLAASLRSFPFGREETHAP